MLEIIFSFPLVLVPLVSIISISPCGGWGPAVFTACEPECEILNMGICIYREIAHGSHLDCCCWDFKFHVLNKLAQTRAIDFFSTFSHICFLGLTLCMKRWICISLILWVWRLSVYFIFPLSSLTKNTYFGQHYI